MSQSEVNIDDEIQLGEVETAVLEEQCPPFFNEQNSRLWGLTGGQPVQIILKQQAYLQILSHAKSDLRQEVGGMLAGRAYQFEGKTYVEVNGALPARTNDSSAVHVTFTAETWREVQRELTEKFPQEQIIGWYHTHPGIGVFLSGQDLFIQKNFFNHPWQIALVVDPIAWKSMFFIWHDREITFARGCLEIFDLTGSTSLVEALIPVAKQPLPDQSVKTQPVQETEPRNVSTAPPSLGRQILRIFYALLRLIWKGNVSHSRAAAQPGSQVEAESQTEALPENQPSKDQPASQVGAESQIEALPEVQSSDDQAITQSEGQSNDQPETQDEKPDA